ncbi:MAG: FAD:protein FMN transferase [Ruminococcaceae bacterium]|nr:FAD:protein FMN transferase [Oscillospiraceae bacterium]
MRRKPFIRAVSIAITAILAVSVLFGCSGQSMKEQERTSFLFDTIISIKLRCDNDAESVLDDVFSLCEHYNSLFDRYDPESDIYRINHSEGLPCEVNPETAEMLSAALDYSRLSGGRYDISCGSVTILWDFTSDVPLLPDPSALESALETVGFENVIIDGCTVTVPQGTELDPGGIAKGFIADKAADFIRSAGVESAVINLGGNVCVVGDKDGQPFKVGIQSPFESGSIGYVSVTDCSVVTAGSYQRCFELDGTLYHHILDLTDGMPSRSGVASVTIISRSSAQADALATACFIMGVEDGMTLIDSLEGVEAIFVTEDGEVCMTDGARAVTALY